MLTLVVAVGLVALAAVLKAVLERRTTQVVAPPEPPPVERAVLAPTNPPLAANSSNTAAILEGLRVAERMRALDEVRELQAAGGATPNTTELLLNKLTHKEADVREAALQALVHLGDTNVLPGLEQALATIENPREKVAMMDAIEYLKLPTALSDLPPVASPDGGNADPTIRPKAPPAAPNSTTPAGKTQRPVRDLSQRARGYQTTPGTQPVSPAPTATPPQ